MICIKNGNIHDAVHKEAYVADILIDDGKIKGAVVFLIDPTQIIL